MSFTELGIAPDLVRAGILGPGRAVARAGTGRAGPFGRKVGHAFVSRTGSGKTLAYLLPILSRIDSSRTALQAVSAPTHELAMQITRVAQELIRAAGLPIRVQALIGGLRPVGRLRV